MKTITKKLERKISSSPKISMIWNRWKHSIVLRKILTYYNFSSKIRGRMDVCYVSYLCFRAEIANYKENLNFVGGKLCKNIANNQKYWLITWFIDNIERGAPFVYFKILNDLNSNKNNFKSIK